MEAVYQLLKKEFSTFGTEAISLVLVCAAILFCLAERRRLGSGIGMLLKYEVLFLLVLGNPFGYNNIRTFWMQDAYWKMFLLLLPAICIAVPVVEITMRQKYVWTGMLSFLACVGIVAVSMNFMFSEVKLAVPENSYKVDEEIVAVDQILRESGQPIKNMIAPREVCAQIREINPAVNLLYGEELIEQMAAGTALAEDETEQQFIDMCKTIVAVPSAVDHQLQVAAYYGSNCIALETLYDDAGMMEEAGYHCIGRTEAFAVYMR